MPKNQKTIVEEVATREPPGTLSIRTLCVLADTNQYGDIFGRMNMGSYTLIDSCTPRRFRKHSKTTRMRLGELIGRCPDRQQAEHRRHRSRPRSRWSACNRQSAPNPKPDEREGQAGGREPDGKEMTWL
jgi:hypothetical protein